MGLDQYGSSDQVNEASGRVADQARNELGENSNDMAEQAYLMNIQSLFDQEVREKYSYDNLFKTNETIECVQLIEIKSILWKE